MSILISIFRWVEDKPVADRLMGIWSYIVKVVEFWEKVTKSKRPACKVILPWLRLFKTLWLLQNSNFSVFFASQFQLFLVVYQTDNPMVPFLYQDLFKLTCKIMQLIVKPDLLRKCESVRDLKKIHLLDKYIEAQIY